MLAEGVDPLVERKRQRMGAQLASTRAITFRQCAEAYVKAHEAGWRTAKYAKTGWHDVFRLHVYPHIGDVAVSDVDTGLVLQVLEPIWSKKARTASALRGQIESVLSWAKVRGYRQGENPALWRGHLKHLLPAPRKVATVKHHPALPYEKVSEFLGKLRKDTAVCSRGIEFVVLTAARSGEVRGAKWDEIDLTSKTWTIPAARMKSRCEHRVPLSDPVIALLQALPRLVGNDFVFPGQYNNQPMDARTLTMTLKRIGYRHITIHGFRSTFRDWAAEQTNYPREVAEAALAHVLENKTEAAYRRSDLFEKRRRVMEEWARYCTRPAPAEGKVVPLRENVNG
jgi:integrase